MPPGLGRSAPGTAEAPCLTWLGMPESVDHFVGKLRARASAKAQELEERNAARYDITHPGVGWTRECVAKHLTWRRLYRLLVEIAQEREP